MAGDVYGRGSHCCRLWWVGPFYFLNSRAGFVHVVTHLTLSVHSANRFGKLPLLLSLVSPQYCFVVEHTPLNWVYFPSICSWVCFPSICFLTCTACIPAVHEHDEWIPLKHLGPDGRNPSFVHWLRILGSITLHIWRLNVCTVTSRRTHIPLVDCNPSFFFVVKPLYSTVVRVLQNSGHRCVRPEK